MTWRDHLLDEPPPGIRQSVVLEQWVDARRSSTVDPKAQPLIDQVSDGLLEIPTYLDRRGEVPKHICAQCAGNPDGLEEAHCYGDMVIWLHPECRPFWFRKHPQ